MKGWRSCRVWVGWDIMDPRGARAMHPGKTIQGPEDGSRAWNLMGSAAAQVIGQLRGQCCGVWAM